MWHSEISTSQHRQSTAGTGIGPQSSMFHCHQWKDVDGADRLMCILMRDHLTKDEHRDSKSHVQVLIHSEYHPGFTRLHANHRLHSINICYGRMRK